MRYALNNPLIYTDPDGESPILLAPVLFRGVILLGDFVSNVVNGIDNPGQTAWNTMGSVVSGINSILQLPIYKNKNSLVTIGIMPLNLSGSISYIKQEDNFTYSSQLGYGLSGGFVGGSVNYSHGDWNVGIGVGAGKNVVGAGLDIRYKGYGGGYHFTYYGGGQTVDGIPMKQNLGGVNLHFDNVSFTIQNDFLAGSGDKGRSNAMEISIYGVTIGTHLFTNKGQGSVDLGEDYLHFDRNKKKYGRWKNGKVFSSPLYLGIRLDDQVARIGYSYRFFQHFTQNLVHKNGFPLLTYFNIGFQNYYLDYSNFKTGIYYYGGWYNPYSIWEIGRAHV